MGWLGDDLFKADDLPTLIGVLPFDCAPQFLGIVRFEDGFEVSFHTRLFTGELEHSERVGIGVTYCLLYVHCTHIRSLSQ